MEGSSLLPLKSFFSSLLAPFIPALCLACKENLREEDSLLCPACVQSLSWIPEDLVCHKCGTPKTDIVCEICHETEQVYDLCRAVFCFSGAVQVLVHELKYNSFRAPAQWFAKAAVAYLEESKVFGEIDLVMPIPLHRVRRRERGYNQSALIAKAIARGLNLEYSEALRRRYYTQSQTHLGKDERMQNLKGAFVLRKDALLRGRRILLVDDVFTTGSTVNESSKLLRSAEAEKVFVLAMARAV